MLESGAVELQCAAAVVLGELRPSGAAPRKALARALKSPVEQVKLCALEALARIDAVQALPHLVPLLSDSGHVRAQASRMLASMGSAAAEALRKELKTAGPEARQSILEVLGELRDVDTTEALFGGLLDSDLDVARGAAHAYRRRIAGMKSPERAKALRKLLDFMKSPKVQKIRTPLAQCLSLVGAFGDPSAAKTVLGYLDRKHPPAARSQALRTLASLGLKGPVAAAAAKKILPMLDDADFGGIVQPALEALEKLPLGREEGDRLLKMLESRHPRVRLFAAKALGGVGTAPVAAALAGALASSDQAIVDVAGAALRSNPAFVAHLVKLLQRSKELPEAWRVANVLRSAQSGFDKQVVRKLVADCLSRIQSRDPVAQAFFEVLRVAAPETLRKALLEKGRKLIASKKPVDAERHLRLLEGGDLATPDTELALGIARLRLQRLDPALAGRDRGKALMMFVRLVHRADFPLVKRLEKDASLVTPEGLLYLGFGLAERQGAEREAGAAVLKMVAKKYSSRNVGKIARQKLKTQGI